MTEVRLRRGPLCRLASSNTQAFLSLVCLAVLAGIAYGLANGRPVFGGRVWEWLPALVFFVPWLLGVTAWARADEDGVRWRYWIKTEFRWDQIRRIELTDRQFVLPESGGRTRSIVVFTKPRQGQGRESADEQNIRPAEAAGRHLRQFGTELTALARQHGVRVVVRGRGWDEPMPEGAEERSWI